MPAGEESKPLNILVVEDREDDAELIMHDLRRAGLEFSWRRVQTRDEFLESLNPALDIILSDYSLPHFDALQALALLSASNLDIPLIIVSGTIGEEAAVEALKHGAVDYLLKDRLGRLAGAVERALRERALRAQRREALEALRQSELRYRKMVEDSLQGIVVAQDARAIYCNQAYADMMGDTVEELLAMSPEETAALIHPDDIDRLQRFHRARMSGDTTTDRYEFRVLRKDGAVRWLDAFVATTTFRGRPASQAFYVDVTAHKQAEEAAREQRVRERVEQILNAIGEGVVVLDGHGCVQQVNPAFLLQTGYDEDEILGVRYKLLWSMGIDGAAGSFLQKVREELAHGASWRGQTTVRRRNGATFDAAMTITKLNGDGSEGRELVVSIRDISQMKEVERMKDSIISVAAHELRTPLTTIGLYSEALATRAVHADQQKRYINAIFEQSQQLNKIIDAMLDLARLEAGRGLEIAAEPVDITALVREVVRPFSELQPHHRFRMEQLTVGHCVKGDPLRLTQVLRNIISNAVKYSPAGGDITIRGRDDDGFVEISVQDEGIGMTPEEQVHLFEKFYRVPSARNGPGGTGLGLAITRLIVEGHGGRISAHSEAGVGSTFTFTLPAASP